MITEIADGIFSADHAVAEGKNAIAFGQRAALAVDCGTHASEGAASAAFIRERGFKADRVVITHCHTDHILGGQAFAGAEVFAHANAPAVIRRHLANFARVLKCTEAEVTRRLLQPTVLFTGDLTIDLGGRVARLLYTPGHSEDHISVYFEEQQVLIAGDVVVNSIIPAFGDGSSRVLETTLERLLVLPLKKLLPGHGTLIEGPNITATLTWTIGYLRAVRAIARDVISAGGSKETAWAAADFGKLVGNRLDRTRMLIRHQNSVTKIFEEETARRSTNS